jgi:hypothetical protein
MDDMFAGAINYTYPIPPRQELPPRQEQPPQGVAFEIHNAFNKFDSTVKTDYLTLINQPNLTGNLVYFIHGQFTNNIRLLFPGDSTKLAQFETAFNKGHEFISRVTEDYKQLIAKSVSFAFSQDEDFKKEYIINFLDETCNAYSGTGDRTSCSKGIVERLVLSVGYAIQNYCIEGCENETLQQLNILLNPSFSIPDTAHEWWQNVETNEAVNAMSPENRKANFIEYLTNEARKSNSYSEYTKNEIIKYANEIDYAFAGLALGGGRTRKGRTRKSRNGKKGRKTRYGRKTKNGRKTRYGRKSRKGKRGQKTKTKKRK